MATVKAEWVLELNVECPKCNEIFDLRHELVDNASPVQACETDTVATRDYETACSECGHEFLCDFVY